MKIGRNSFKNCWKVQKQEQNEKPEEETKRERERNYIGVRRRERNKRGGKDGIGKEV